MNVNLNKLDAFHCLSEEMSLNGTTKEQSKKIVSDMSSLNSIISVLHDYFSQDRFKCIWMLQ